MTHGVSQLVGTFAAQTGAAAGGVYDRLVRRQAPLHTVRTGSEHRGRHGRRERRRKEEGGRHGAVSVNTILYPPPEHLRFTPCHTVSHSRCSV